MTTKKIVIKDALTDEYYCVEMTAKDYHGNLIAGDNDFPYWSKNIREAYNFQETWMAKNEMFMNDLTVGGSRFPIIVFKQKIDGINFKSQSAVDAYLENKEYSKKF